MTLPAVDLGVLSRQAEGCGVVIEGERPELELPAIRSMTGRAVHGEGCTVR